MNTGIFRELWDTYQWSCETVDDMARFQCQVLRAQYGAGTKILSRILGSNAVEQGATAHTAEPPEAAKSQAPAGAEAIVEQAIKRLKEGFAPPREIYDIRNRRLMDWSGLPDWARPIDPELFEGCAHEG